MFWLDGHFSAGVTHGANDANPLLAELAAISTSNVGPHVVATDDVSSLSDRESNCSLSDVIRALEQIDDSCTFYFDYDVLVALPGIDDRSQFWGKIAPPFVIR